MIEGVYVANVTPFREGSYEINVESYLAHVEWLAGHGVRGVVPFGTNGEGPAVSLPEKRRVLEALFEREFPLQIIPTVAQGNLPDTLEMLRWLDDFPAEAVMVLPPYYHKPATTEGLSRFYEPVLAATRHTIVLYHIPKYAVPIPEDLVRELSVWGVKDSGGDSAYAEVVLGMGKGVLLGTEDDLWRNLNLGAQGMISALANFIPERIVEMDKLVEKGAETEGKRLSGNLQRVRGMTKEYTSAALLKRISEARHGHPMGTVRPPLVPAPEDYDPAPILREAGVEFG
jgi:dihydrodipicolinate synthase/N-acetylneuraminate lyase